MNHTQPSSEVISNSISLLPDASPDPGRGTILVVEDNPSLLDTTGEVLECAGYRVLKARTAAEATNVFHRYKAIVRLLLTDVVLPGKNGRELANELRSICPNLHTIFISGYPENVITKDGIKEGGMFYLPKPFCMQSLTLKVRQVLEPQEPGGSNI